MEEEEDKSWRNATGGSLQGAEDEKFVYICSALFSLCYLLAGVLCCRCYWLHLRRKMEGTGLGNNEAANKEEENEEGHHQQEEELVEVSAEGENEFLDAKCC